MILKTMFPGYSMIKKSVSACEQKGKQPTSKQAPRKSVSQFFQLMAIALFAAAVFSSCEKEQLSNPSADRNAMNDGMMANATNSAPQVDAGALKRIIYPAATSTTLSGSGSDADGAVTYRWTQTGGNSTAAIAEPTRARTNVSNLKPGLYTFTLTVTDNSGTSRSDNVFVTVLETMTWNVNGVMREALVHPATGNTGAAPVIFAFHGHGGTDKGFSGKGFELEWPEAIVVYPQGLPTKSNGDQAAKNPGWQHSVGEVNTNTGIIDQDLKFFDAMLSTLKSKYNVNSQQVFAHGWSNGGEFVYDVLWSVRADKLAALAPSAAVLNSTNGKTPLPVIHTAGTNDQSVKFSRQQDCVSSVRSLDRCSSNGTNWASGPNGLLGTKYASSINTPVVFLQYNGGHGYPATVPPLIVKFFKEVAAL